MSKHAVMVMDGDRVVASRFGVPSDEVLSVLDELLATTGPNLRVMVDGREVEREPEQPAVPAPVAAVQVVPNGTQRLDIEGVDLAHHMLWESYKRASQVQGFMLEKMTGVAVEMNRRYVEQLEEMRGKYTKALEKIDGLQFEQKMLEHENAARHLSNHYARLAEEEHLAAERRRRDNQSAFEQLARQVVRVINVISDDDPSMKN